MYTTNRDDNMDVPLRGSISNVIRVELLSCNWSVPRSLLTRQGPLNLD